MTLSTAKLIKEERMLLFNLISSIFMTDKNSVHNRHKTSIASFGSVDSEMKRWHAWETYITKGVSSDNVSILNLKGSGIYDNLGIACSGNDLELEQKTVSLCLKQVVAPDNSTPIHQICYTSSKLSLKEFRTNLKKFIEINNKVDSYEQSVKNLILAFNMEFYLFARDSDDVSSMIKKYHYEYDWFTKVS